MALRRAVFLDRDGVINVFPGPGKFVLSWPEFAFMPGVHAELRRLRAAGYFLALVTNQSGVGRGLMDLETLHEIHRRMQDELGDGRLDALYYCPHHPADGCPCRKPAPWLLQRAAQEHALDLTGSFLIGDSGRDIEMGRAAGCRTALCREHLPASLEQLKPLHRPEVMFQRLKDAIDWILRTNS